MRQIATALIEGIAMPTPGFAAVDAARVA